MSTQVISTPVRPVHSRGALRSTSGFAPWHLLVFLILNFAIAGVALQCLSVYLYKHKAIPAYCDGTVIHPLHDMASRYQEQDSWYPMLKALNATSAPAGIYQSLFFNDRTKFQYPLASLLPIDVLRRAGLSDATLLDALKWLSICAFFGQIPCIFLILSRTFKEPQNPWLIAALTLFLVIGFYPLARAYAAGQIQIFLDLLFSAAFLAWIDQRDRVSGFLVGLSVLVKPQYGLFLIWALVRRKWSFLSGAAVPWIAGTLTAVLAYGWKNNIQYLDVIRYMSRHGEAYYPNQSVNGLLNRLLFNGPNTVFDVHGFAPFLPVVYWLTVSTSLLIVALALLNKRPHTKSGMIAEFGVIAIAATLASPIAWEHHYGILLPLFAWVLPWSADNSKWPGASLSALLIPLVAFVLCADDWRITNLLANQAPWNLFQSTLLFGALILFFRLWGIVRSGGVFSPVKKEASLNHLCLVPSH